MEQWYRHVCSGGCPSILTWDVFKLIQYLNIEELWPTRYLSELF